MSQKRRASLSGWWMYLPFVAVPVALLFSEVWFQTRILHNEYRKNAVRETIRQTDARVAELDDEIRELGRMERVLERAVDLGLAPPNPGQVIEIAVATDMQQEHEVVLVQPVLAERPKIAEPVAVAKVDVRRPAPRPDDWTELEPLEPEGDWVE